MSVADYNTDPDSNTSISGINIAEGCPPSGINNAIRQMMADIKDKADSTDTAITTLDGAAVKLSGVQTITGAKTFSSSIIMPSTSSKPSFKSGAETSAVRFWGGDTVDGARLALFGQSAAGYPGQFTMTAADSVNTRQFRGYPDGTLTWDGKGFVYASGDQDITGAKTFKAGKNDTNVIIKSTDITYNTKPSSTAAQGILRFRSNDDYSTGIIDIVRYNTGVQYRQVNAFCYNGTDGKGFRIRADGTVTTPAWAVEPSDNGAILLGRSAARWKEIWCTQSSINSSSDERIKQQVADIPDTVLDAWGDVDWIQFKYNDSCEEKGADKARLHNGLIAQRVDAAFKAHGLDASQYGLFLYDAWEAEPEVRDEKGEVMQEARPAGDAYGLRYTEALCMEAAYQRRRADRAEARITELERRLDEMESVLASIGGQA